LHFHADLSSGGASIGVSHLVKVGDGLLAGIWLEVWNLVTRLGDVSNAKSASTAKDNDVEKRVCTKTIGTMDRGTSCFTCGEQAWDDGIWILFRWS
jgi:hypothetical protein